MKSGAIAVENSVDALRELKSSKIKNRTPMVHVSPPHSHYRQPSRPHEPQLVHYQPHLFAHAPMPYQSQPQSFAVLQSYPAVRTVPTYPRHGASAAAVVPFGIRHTATADQLQYMYKQPPPPPLPQQDSDAKRKIKQSVAHHQPPPASLPVQLQASAAVSGPRGRAKRGVCVRYTRGSCYYGSSCKFFHDDDSLTTVPQSAPAAIAEHSQLPLSPVPPKDNQSNAPSSLRDDDFPLLWAKTSPRYPSADLRRSLLAGDQPTSSPSKKLVFLDAVLQQNGRTNEVKANGLSPLKPRTKSGDDEEVYSTNQSLSETDEESELPQITTVNVQGTQGDRPLLPAQDLGHNTHTNQGRRDCQFRRTSPQPAHQHFAQRSPLQAVLPEPGQSGYAVQPLYVNAQDQVTDDYSAFSILSRDANDFVKRLDSRLQELVSFQERAIEKLQDTVANLWSDSTIGVYGSSFTRLALPQSDVDCVLSSPSQTHEQPSNLLRKLAVELRRHSWARRVELLDGAKIPVLKVVFCHSPKSRNEVMLDLTCAHSAGHSGLRARDLIYSYQVEMPALRPLVLILKSHIQRRGLNSAYTGGLSSYGLVLLAIRFLQACGDEHHVRETVKCGRVDGGHRMPETGVHTNGYTQHRSIAISNSPPVYEFTRDGKLTWRTGLGNLLLLFLETYVTFDYRRFGVSVEGTGQYFPLPSEMVPLEPGAVVSPYIVDPISTTRSIGNSFRMHEIIQAWYEFYQQLTNGISVDDAISSRALSA